MHIRLRPAALATALCLSHATAFYPAISRGADTPAATPAVSPNAGGGLRLPSYVTADRIEGTTEKDVTASGNAEIRRGKVLIGADWLHYDSDTEEVRARGNVRIERDGDVIRGPSLRYRTSNGTGEFQQPDYVLSPRKIVNLPPGQTPVEGRGHAELIEFQGEERYLLKGTTFTTCKPGEPGWYARAGEMQLDMNREVGTARNAAIYFLDVPILYTPWLSFSLNNERKTGLLLPGIGSTSQGGAEVTIPYYFNIAPNMDFTLAARAMEKRGTQINGQFRYLEPTFAGDLRFEELPNDKVVGTHRSALTFNHSYNREFMGGHLLGGMSISKVSDDAYFRDLSSRLNLTAQTHLLREGFFGYTGTWWGSGTYGVTGKVQRFQTLQDPSNPVVTPYSRAPQVTLDAIRQDLNGLDFAMKGEYVDFTHPTLVVGRRFTAYPSVSLPLISAGGFLTPKIGLHSTKYSLERAAPGTLQSIDRAVPILSVDSGLVFERETRFGGKAFTQTLEPRAYYLRAPYRNQDQIPLFDTAVGDFNYAQIFSENSFIGGDRINDANQLTLALTSRVLAPGSGQEAVKATVGQRYYYSDQEVTLKPGDTRRAAKSSDWLAALSGRVSQNWTAETAVQYNPRESRNERFTVSARYQPGPFKALNLSHRFLRDQISQVDVSVQWPIIDNWYGVGRYNYSVRDRRIIETLGGLEYNGDCWISRFVVQRFATATGQTTNTMFLQLELNGFSRIGSNPLETLKRNIPGYARLNQAPSANQTHEFFD
jgi:LPS-assembly protein